MADLGSVGLNGEIASRSAVGYSEYGPVVGFSTPTAEFRSVPTAGDTPFDYAWYGNMKQWSPASPYTILSGVTQVEGVGTEGLPVYILDRDTGQLLSKTLSGPDGSFTLPAVGRGQVLVLGTDGVDYNAIVFDRVIPV